MDQLRVAFVVGGGRITFGYGASDKSHTQVFAASGLIHCLYKSVVIAGVYYRIVL